MEPITIPAIRLTKRRLLALSMIVILFSGFGYVAYAATQPTGTSGNIVVSAAPGFVVTAANLNGTACTITGGGSGFSCGGLALSQGQSVTLSVTVSNSAHIQQSLTAPTYSYASCTCSTPSDFTVAPNNSYPDPINPQSTTTVSFALTGSATQTGTDAVTITL